MSTYSGVNARLALCLNSVLNVKVVVAAFNQEMALVGSFSVIMNLRMELFGALLGSSAVFLVRNSALISANTRRRGSDDCGNQSPQFHQTRDLGWCRWCVDNDEPEHVGI